MEKLVLSIKIFWIHYIFKEIRNSKGLEISKILQIDLESKIVTALHSLMENLVFLLLFLWLKIFLKYSTLQKDSKSQKNSRLLLNPILFRLYILCESYFSHVKLFRTQDISKGPEKSKAFKIQKWLEITLEFKTLPAWRLVIEKLILSFIIFKTQDILKWLEILKAPEIPEGFEMVLECTTVLAFIHLCKRYFSHFTFSVLNIFIKDSKA